MFHETEVLGDAKVSYGRGHQDPIGSGLVTQARGELHRCADRSSPSVTGSPAASPTLTLKATSGCSAISGGITKESMTLRVDFNDAIGDHPVRFAVHRFLESRKAQQQHERVDHKASR
jgi:hypothetical protein